MTKNNWINVWSIQKKVLPLQWGNQGARAEAVDSTSVGVGTKKVATHHEQPLSSLNTFNFLWNLIISIISYYILTLGAFLQGL